MADLELSSVIAALRKELASAMGAGAGQELRFEAKELVVELQVGITRSAEAKGGIKFWVIELGGGGSKGKESVQKITLTLDPQLARGGRVRIASDTDESPLQQ